jgi:soluble lytic murein transglycosylase-like protein
LASVAAAESAFDPRALSPKGAAGLMQLMPATARRFKVGNRYSPVQSLNGGAAYLRWLTDRFGNDLPRVVAAYNAGEQAVALADGIPRYAETQVYVQRVLNYLEHFSKVLSTPTRQAARPAPAQAVRPANSAACCGSQQGGHDPIS